MSMLDSTVNTQPIAKICGQPLLEIPRDLYIPPEALEVFLETFEGPLDLLLYLIRKHNLDILDIPMAELTQQYMAYVDMMRADQFELAAEYLLITALLIEIKSRMLLPHPVTAVEEETDPRAELVRRLLEYEQMKKASMRLNELPQANRDFAPVQVWIDHVATKQLAHVNVDDLRHAWIALIERAKVNRHHHIGHEEISVRACMSQILRSLQGHDAVRFDELFSKTAGVVEIVANFLALLELAKETLVDITQSENFGTIYVKSTQSAPSL
ncbi:ScpA family protein [Nitrosomonas sp. Nm58]|uniref:segregation and condensation protein A n=1 Tax=Nitrosomonas sp. Nm58 TaxID=200126 RepID=UPI00089B4A3D|nr:ScpA family protein [Nitrosomonas sp. Nm58]SDY18267.1 condensin subunit ScpA [Nitrosomonas sp. Nm58]